METGSYQLTPCFSTRSPPTSNSLPLPVRSSLRPPSVSLSLSLSLSGDGDLFSPFSPPTHPPPASLAPHISHTPVPSHLALSSLAACRSPPSLLCFSTLCPRSSFLPPFHRLDEQLKNPQKERKRGGEKLCDRRARMRKKDDELKGETSGWEVKSKCSRMIPSQFPFMWISRGKTRTNKY